MTAATIERQSPLWRAVVLSFAPPDKRARIDALLRHLPVLVILLVQVLLTLRLNNLANSDEALYIDAGHNYFAQWSGGPHAPDYGSYFSGFPYAYPLFAAVLDNIGGLGLVRFASLLLMLGATLCVRSIAAHLAGPIHARGAGLAGMFFCACASPTLFVGNFATFDAACTTLTILAVMLVVTRRSALSAIIAGLAISAAALVKYTGGVFIPAVIVLALLSVRNVRSGAVRAILVTVTAGACLTDVYVKEHLFIGAGISFSTSDRTVENYRSYSLLLQQFAVGAGVLTILAVLGVVLTWRRARSMRVTLTQLVMLTAGLLVPASQIYIHEYTSFNKHLVFLTVFLAPLAAQVVVLRARVAKAFVVVAAAYLVFVFAILQSTAMFDEWPDPSRVIATVNKEDRPGAYIGVGADSIAYYEKGKPQFTWSEPFALYGAGSDAIRKAIADQTYAGIFYTSGSSASAQLDADTALVTRLLEADPHYELVASWPKHKYDQDMWFVWMRRSPISSTPPKS